MSDLNLERNAEFGHELTLFNGDLALDPSLRSAVLVSLLTDREVPQNLTPEQLAEYGNERRGWWGDALNEDPADRTGSHLWLLSRAKRTPQVLVQVKAYAEQALRWLIEDGIAQRVTVTPEFGPADSVGYSVEIVRPGGARELIRFGGLWDASLGPSVTEQIQSSFNQNALLLGGLEYEFNYHYPEVDGP